MLKRKYWFDTQRVIYFRHLFLLFWWLWLTVNKKPIYTHEIIIGHNHCLKDGLLIDKCYVKAILWHTHSWLICCIIIVNHNWSINKEGCCSDCCIKKCWWKVMQRKTWHGKWCTGKKTTTEALWICWFNVQQYLAPANTAKKSFITCFNENAIDQKMELTQTLKNVMHYC